MNEKVLNRISKSFYLTSIKVYNFTTIPILTKYSEKMKSSCFLESENYAKCVDLKGINNKLFECEKEYSLLIKCLKAKK